MDWDAPSRTFAAQSIAGGAQFVRAFSRPDFQELSLTHGLRKPVSRRRLLRTA
jgi:hypothetical protein